MGQRLTKERLNKKHVSKNATQNGCPVTSGEELQPSCDCNTAREMMIQKQDGCTATSGQPLYPHLGQDGVAGTSAQEQEPSAPPAPQPEVNQDGGPVTSGATNDDGDELSEHDKRTVVIAELRKILDEIAGQGRTQNFKCYVFDRRVWSEDRKEAICRIIESECSEDSFQFLAQMKKLDFSLVETTWSLASDFIRFEVDLHWDPDEDEGRLRDDVRARHMGYPAPGADPAGGNPHNQSQNLHYQTPYPGRQPSQDSYNQAQHTVYHPVPGAYPIGSNFYSSTHEYQTPYPRGQPNQDNIHLQHLGFSILGVNPGDRIQSSNRQYQINVHSPGYIIVGTYIAYAEHSCARMHDSQYQGQYPGVSTHNQEGQVHCCGAHRALEALLTPSGLERHLHGGLYSRMQTQNPDGIPTASGGQYPAPQTGIPTASSGQYQAPQSQAQVAQGLNQVSGQTPQQGSRSQYPSWTPRYQDLQGQNAARPNQGYQGPQLQRQAPGPQDLQSQTQRSQISNPRGQMTQSRPMTNQNDSRPRGSLITPPQGPIPAPLPASHDHTVPGSLSPQTQQHSRAQQTPQGGTIPKTYEFQTAQIAQQEAGPGALFFVGHGGTVHHMIAETRAGGIQGATVRQPQVQAPQTQDGATSRSAASQMPGQASQGVTITQAQRPQAQAGGQVGAASISASQIPGQAPQGATIPQAQGTTQAGQGGTSASASPDPAPEAEQAMRPEYQIKRVPRGSQAPIGTSGFQTPQGGTIPSTAGLHASQAPGATSQGPANQGDGHAHFSSGHQVPYGWATSGSQKRTAPPGEGHAQCCGAHQVPHGWATSGSQERTAPPGESQPTQQQQGANPEREQQPSQGSPWWVGRWDQFPEHIRRNVIEDFFHENNSN